MKKKRNIIILIGVIAIISLVINSIYYYNRSFSNLTPSENLQILMDSKGYLYADKYKVFSNVSFAFSTIVNIVVPYLFLKKWAKNSNSSKVGFLTVCKSLITIYGIIFLIKFPIRFYGSYIFRKRMGLYIGTFGTWLLEVVRNFSIELVISIIIMYVFISIYLKCKDNYKKFFGISIPIVIVLLAVSFYINPIIEPMFEKLTPLTGNLEKSIHELTKKANIGEPELYVKTMSSKVNELNAYMTGVFNSRRIVIWDNTLNKLTEDEILYITAHEIGHYYYKHIDKSLAITIVLSISELIILWVIAKKTKPKGKSIIAMAILLSSLYGYIYSPFLNIYGRKIEKDCDIYALKLTNNKEAAYSAMRKLSADGVIIQKPNYIYYIWNYDHPLIMERMDYIKGFKIIDK